MRSAHPILGNRNLLIIILDYLDGEDFFQIIQVSFSLRTTIQSVPQFEITLLKYTMKKSNEAIDRLKISDQHSNILEKFPQRSLSSIPFIAMKKKIIEKPKVCQEINNSQTEKTPDFQQDKWIGFVNYFHNYARDQGFDILKRKDFKDDKGWNEYKEKFTSFYQGYVDHIKIVRAQADGQEQRNYKQSCTGYLNLIDKVKYYCKDNYQSFSKKYNERKLVKKPYSLEDYI